MCRWQQPPEKYSGHLALHWQAEQRELYQSLTQCQKAACSVHSYWAKMTSSNSAASLNKCMIRNNSVENGRVSAKRLSISPPNSTDRGAQRAGREVYVASSFWKQVMAFLGVPTTGYFLLQWNVISKQAISAQDCMNWQSLEASGGHLLTLLYYLHPALLWQLFTVALLGTKKNPTGTDYVHRTWKGRSIQGRLNGQDSS